MIMTSNTDDFTVVGGTGTTGRGERDERGDRPGDSDRLADTPHNPPVFFEELRRRPRGVAKQNGGTGFGPLDCGDPMRWMAERGLVQLTYRPFSNSLDYEMWSSHNCDGCTKGFYGSGRQDLTCEIETALNTACFEGGIVSKDIYDRMHSDLLGRCSEYSATTESDAADDEVGPMVPELWDVERMIEYEIERGLKRRDIAKTYALALRSSYPTNWFVVNHMIVKRWSVSGLEWIKEQAHSGKCWNSPAEGAEMEIWR